MATSVRVRVHESGIQSLFVPGGGVNNYGTRVAVTTTANMRQFAIKNMRTGRLLRSFRTRSQVRHNAARWTTYSTAPHALYLQRGTAPRAGNITLYAGVPPVGMRNRGPKLPRSAAYPRWQKYIGARVHSVAGTKPTYFMSRALNQALRRYRLV